MKLLAASDAQPETAKLKSIPPVPFNDEKIPKNPKISIGKSA